MKPLALTALVVLVLSLAVHFGAGPAADSGGLPGAGLMPVFEAIAAVLAVFAWIAEHAIHLAILAGWTLALLVVVRVLR